MCYLYLYKTLNSQANHLQSSAAPNLLNQIQIEFPDWEKERKVLAVTFRELQKLSAWNRWKSSKYLLNGGVPALWLFQCLVSKGLAEGGYGLSHTRVLTQTQQTQTPMWYMEEGKIHTLSWWSIKVHLVSLWSPLPFHFWHRLLTLGEPLLCRCLFV